jgi:hypothetical protein
VTRLGSWASACVRMSPSALDGERFNPMRASRVAHRVAHRRDPQQRDQPVHPRDCERISRPTSRLPRHTTTQRGRKPPLERPRLHRSAGAIAQKAVCRWSTSRLSRPTTSERLKLQAGSAPHRLGEAGVTRLAVPRVSHPETNRVAVAESRTQ